LTKPQLQIEIIKREQVIAQLTLALEKAYYELNTIRARDGVPYTHGGWKSSVCEEYFGSVVDECRAAIKAAKNA
jgi:tetrahydromethanopterin S-methyltransferase subunit B